MWRIQWPDATPGSTQSVRCPGEGDVPGLGLAHRSCLTGGVWGSVDASNCESVAIRDIRIQVCAVMCIEEDKVTVSYRRLQNICNMKAYSETYKGCHVHQSEPLEWVTHCKDFAISCKAPIPRVLIGGHDPPFCFTCCKDSTISCIYSAMYVYLM